MEGRVPEDTLRDILKDLMDQDALVSVRYEYDEDKDETILWLQPCKTFVIHSDPELHARTKCPVSYERKVILKGSLPTFTTADGKKTDFNEKYWVPFRKGCKRNKDSSRWVVMCPHDVYEYKSPAGKLGREPDYTEICLIVDNRCPQEDIPDALDLAAAYISEKLRLIASDINPTMMLSAAILDRFSSDVVDAIHKYNDDETQAHYNALGLRRIDTDTLV